VSIGDLFGIHELALGLRARRADLLAANLANADTPGYRARDLDFSAALEQAIGGSAEGLRRTHPRHLGAGRPQDTVRYRVPLQPSLDGNTVEPHYEKAEFMENAIRYQATLTFLGSRIRGLRLAIRGE